MNEFTVNYTKDTQQLLKCYTKLWTSMEHFNHEIAHFSSGHLHWCVTHPGVRTVHSVELNLSLRPV